MSGICIGIHVHAEPKNLHATLASVRANTTRAYELVFLPDGPDEATRLALTSFGDVRQLATTEPRGAAACFNRLAASTDANVLILLESGSLVGPHWLDHLLAALDADPRHGLAGPSTNHAWNEQGILPHGLGDADAIARTAQEAEHRLGSTWRTLEPLHSLADFCYVVRREVIEAIGAADESYGLGPCWEMDYNIRAARAGWRGVWACAAYVYRAPFTARRQREERLRFEINKHRYQDKFCALRLRGEQQAYEPHCRGEACEHFAPAHLIQIKEPFPPSAVTTDHAVQQTPRAIASPLSAEKPLVSCIMPTYNRRTFVPHAIEYFLRQDYARKELIIVDDGADPIGDLGPADDRIRYIRLAERRTIGAKRNLACEAARGDIICHWDDDDWHAAWRITYQVEALQREYAAVCGINQLLFYELITNRAWQYVYPKDQRFWLSGSSLCYPRSFWAAHRFADINVGEDARFVWSDAQAKMIALPDYTFHVGMIHPHNVSPKRTGNAYWTGLDVSEIRRVLGDDFWKYQAKPAQDVAAPLVSCIMPTYNRRAFIPLAIQHFLSQDYRNKELLIVDDGDDAIGDLVDNVAGARYIRLKQRMSIGAKRNLACREARGEIIAQWDDDDWYAPNRLSYQTALILSDEADLTGLDNAYMLLLPDGVFWTTQRALHQRMFLGDVHGGTLVFRKRLIDEGLCYPEVNLAEDAGLLKQAMQRGKRLARLLNPGVFVYVRHGQNAWQFKPGQFLEPAGWQRIDPPSFATEIVNAYRAILQSLS